MVQKRRLFLSLVSFFIVTASFGQEFVTRILQTSTSGKTLLVDRGSWEGVKLNDLAVVIKDVTNAKGYKELRPILKLRSVKLFDTTSVWVVLQEIEKTELKSNSKIFLLTESELLNGREKLTLKRTKFISHKDKTQKFTEEELKRNNLALSKKRENYRKDRTLHKTKELYDKDVELVDIDQWEKIPGSRTLNHPSLYRSQYAEDFSYRKRVATFEKMVSHFVEKYSDLNFNRENFYADQKRDPIQDEFQEKSLKQTLFDKMVYEDRKDREAAKKLAEEFREKGPGWSDEYSDEELSELVTRAGITNELIRQEEKVMSRFNGQYFLSFGLNIFDNENDLDPNNHQDNRYDLELGMEYFAFKRFDNLLSRFSVEGSFRRSQDGFEANYNNALIEDYSIAGFINYYPFQVPTDVSKNIFYIGLGFRTGYASLSIPSLGEEGSYQLVSFPVLRSGLKYSFSNGYGARLSFTYEKVNLIRIKTNTESISALQDQLGLTEGKLGISLTKLF